MFFVFHVSTLARLASPPVLGVVAGRSFRALCIIIDVAPSSARGLVELVRKVQMLHFLPRGHCYTLPHRWRSTARCIHNSLGGLQNVYIVN